LFLPFTVGYEVDLFGRRRRSIEAAQASYQASAADLENVRLVITAELGRRLFHPATARYRAGNPESHRGDAAKRSAAGGFPAKGGVASGLDVAQEETLLNIKKQRPDAWQRQVPRLLSGDDLRGFLAGASLEAGNREFVAFSNATGNWSSEA